MPSQPENCRSPKARLYARLWLVRSSDVSRDRLRFSYVGRKLGRRFCPNERASNRCVVLPTRPLSVSSRSGGRPPTSQRVEAAVGPPSASAGSLSHVAAASVRARRKDMPNAPVAMSASTRSRVGLRSRRRRPSALCGPEHKHSRTAARMATERRLATESCVRCTSRRAGGASRGSGDSLRQRRLLAAAQRRLLNGSVA